MNMGKVKQELLEPAMQRMEQTGYNDYWRGKEAKDNPFGLDPESWQYQCWEKGHERASLEDAKGEEVDGQNLSVDEDVEVIMTDEDDEPPFDYADDEVEEMLDVRAFEREVLK